MEDQTKRLFPARSIFCFIIILLMIIAPSAAADMPGGTDVATHAAPVSPELGFRDRVADISVPFVENAGQADSQVRFYADTFYGTGYITGTGITHRIRGRDNTTLVLTEEFVDQKGRVIPLSPAGEEQSSTLVSYFIGNDSAQWRTGLASWNVVSLGELYPGITVILRARGGAIEKILYVSPGVRPETVRIRVRGADRMHINGDGKLVLLSSLAGNVSMTRPVAYQDRSGLQDPVASRYILSGNTYGYAVGNYDAARQLVIDPALDYSTYIGGTGDDGGNDIAVDGSGNAYITGYTMSADFPTTPGAFQATYTGGGNDAVITKLNPAGTALVYSTYLGGTNDDYGDGIAVDGSGNAYISGSSSSPNFPITPGAFQTVFAGMNDVFIAKLNPAGTALVYSTYLGGTNDDYGDGIVVDGSGNAYITGYTWSPDFPATAGAFQPAYGGGTYDGIIAKLNAAGTALVYSTYIGGTGTESGKGITMDGAGNVYITGSSSSSNFPTTVGAYQTVYGGSIDGIITKLNAAGTGLEYSTYLGGSDPDSGNGIAVDDSGNAYIIGYTRSVNFPTTVGAYQTVYRGIEYDYTITKLNAAGTGLEYSTYLGGTGSDIGYGIAVDGSGNAYITGYTQSTDFPTTAGAYQTVHGGGWTDCIITKLNSAGTALEYSTYLGGMHTEAGNGIAVDGSGNAYITGFTYSGNFPTTAGAFQTTHGGGSYDAFAVSSPLLPLPILTSLSMAGGDTAGGTPVTITGSGFTGATSVLFGTTAGTSLTIVNDTTITVVSPAHAAGTVDITVTTPVGTSAVVATDQFTFGPPPVAGFTGTPVTGTAPLAVTFNDASDNAGGTMWNWSFGDTAWDNGTVSTNPVHTYASAGTYTVTLTVTNLTGSNTLTRAGYIKVAVPPTPTPPTPTTATPTPPTPTTAPPAPETPAYTPQDSGEILSDFPTSALPPMTVTVNIGGDSKARQAIVTGTKLSELIVTGKEQHGPVTGCNPPAGIVFQYLGLEPARYGTITNAVINFTMPQSWLDENHIAPASVVLYRMTPDCWHPLPTTMVYTKKGTAYFSAVSPGFPQFAIAGTPAVLSPEVVASVQEPVSTTAGQDRVPVPAAVAKAPVATQTTAPPAPFPAPPSSSSPVVPALIILCCAGLIGGGWYVRRWWIRRQNPALFEE